MKIRGHLIDNYLIIAICIQIAALCTIYLDFPIIRLIVCFTYLTFLPGMSILRIFDLSRLDTTEFLSYSVGLSLSFLMMIGLIINILYPLIGGHRPISLTILIISISLMMVFLFFIDYKLSRSSIKLNKESLRHILPIFILLAIPLLAIAGGRTAYAYSNTFILYVLIIIIGTLALIPLFSNRYIISLYPAIIFFMSLALIYHTSSLSPYLNRIGVDGEFFHTSLVLTQNYWDYQIQTNENSALSLVMLSPIYSLFLGIDIIPIFEFIYPIFFSLVPMLLYKIYNSLFKDENYALISTFFLMFYIYFYLEEPLLRRQMIGLFYFALFLSLVFNNKLTSTQKSALSVIFVPSIIISHYAIGWIFLFFNGLIFIITRINYIFKLNNSSYRNNSPFFNNVFFILLLTFTLSWALYISSGCNFGSITRIISVTQSSLLSFLDPGSRDPAIYSAFGQGFFTLPILGKIYRSIIYIMEVLIFIGYLAIIIKVQDGFNREFKLMCTAFMVFMICFISIPSLSNTNVHFARLFFVSLFILAPLCIVGGDIFWIAFLRVLNRFSLDQFHNIIKNQFLIFFILFWLIPFFLFNVGFIFSMKGYTQTDVDICKIPRSEALCYGIIDTGYIRQTEFLGGKFLGKVIRDTDIVFGDYTYGTDIIGAWHYSREPFTSPMQINLSLIDPNGYIFLRNWNILKKEVRVTTHGILRGEYTYVALNLQNNPFKFRDKLYSNGEVIILSPIS